MRGRFNMTNEFYNENFDSYDDDGIDIRVWEDKYNECLRENGCLSGNNKLSDSDIDINELREFGIRIK